MSSLDEHNQQIQATAIGYGFCTRNRMPCVFNAEKAINCVARAQDCKYLKDAQYIGNQTQKYLMDLPPDITNQAEQRDHDPNAH